MPPQTITEPPPNRSRSTTQASAKRSPRRRYVDHLRDREWTYLWLALSKGELGQQRQQEGGTPDIDFQFDFDFKIGGVATNELQ